MSELEGSGVAGGGNPGVEVDGPELDRAGVQGVDVAIVGGGPAGLSAAIAVRRADPSLRVVVLEREHDAGGIPRHADHQGFGLRDLHRSLTGPAYARRLVDAAASVGVSLRLRTQVTGCSPGSRSEPEEGGLALAVTSPAGLGTVRARAVVLATGCRERPRSARGVAGSRPSQGVMTTGTLQQLVYLRGVSPGQSAVVVGAEHVSFSALATLEHAGTHTVAMLTEFPRHQSYAPFRAGASLLYHAPLLTSTRLVEIRGGRRVESVLIRDVRTGGERVLACDTVIFTGDWIPDHELTVAAGAALDPATCGARVDGALRTDRAGLFAAGNLLQGAETADVAALAGRHVAGSVIAHLREPSWPGRRLPLCCEAPLDWISPSAIEVDVARSHPPRGRYLLRATEELLDVRVAIVQGERTLGRTHLPRVTVGRSASLRASVIGDSLDPDGGPVSVRVISARRHWL